MIFANSIAFSNSKKTLQDAVTIQVQNQRHLLIPVDPPPHQLPWNPPAASACSWVSQERSQSIYSFLSNVLICCELLPMLLYVPAILKLQSNIP